MDLLVVRLREKCQNRFDPSRKEIIRNTSKGVVMKKTSSRDEVVSGILQGLQEAVAFKQGESKTARVTVIESKSALEVRQQLKLNRSEFAHLLGVSERTLEGWEQGRAKPTGAARSLLRVAAHNPSVVLEALR